MGADSGLIKNLLSQLEFIRRLVVALIQVLLAPEVGRGGKVVSRLDMRPLGMNVGWEQQAIVIEMGLDNRVLRHVSLVSAPGEHRLRLDERNNRVLRDERVTIDEVNHIILVLLLNDKRHKVFLKLSSRLLGLVGDSITLVRPFALGLGLLRRCRLWEEWMLTLERLVLKHNRLSVIVREELSWLNMLEL